MKESELTGQWVEIEEECSSDRLVFKSINSRIPPRRGGRRRLNLEGSGATESLQQGPADGLVQVSGSDWRLQSGLLSLDTAAWRGTYEIETLTGEELILKKK